MKNSSQKKNQSMSKTEGKKKANSKPSQVSKGRKSERYSAPLASTRVIRTNVPDVSGSPYSGDGRVRIRHREYIRDVAGSVAFAATSLSINPGLSNVFPWLSVMAANFESYLFRSLRFEYETQKSASTSGSLMMAVDFDSADASPVNKQQLMAFHNAVRSAVWESCSYRSDKADLAKFGVQRFIRSGSLSANQDVKTYDVGNLILGTQGEDDTSAIGELYVEYDVELITPQINADPSIPLSANISTTGVARATPFTGAQTQFLGLSVSASGNTITFNKPGNYLVTYFIVGTVMTDVSPTLGGTATSLFPAAVNYHNTAATAATGQFEVSVTDLGQTVTLDFAASATTITSSILKFAAYPYGY